MQHPFRTREVEIYIWVFHGCCDKVGPNALRRILFEKLGVIRKKLFFNSFKSKTTFLPLCHNNHGRPIYISTSRVLNG